MWIPIVIIALGIIVVATLMFVGRREGQIAEETRRLGAWLSVHKETLRESDRKRLAEAIGRVEKKMEVRDSSLSMFESSCDRAELHDDYEKMVRTYLEVYRSSINENATDEEAFDALETPFSRKFKEGESVYVPKLDLHASVRSVNDDGTYTVCDLTDQCHRVYEHELICKETEKP